MNSIRFVPTSIHGIFDYIGGVGLIAAPFVFGFFNVGGIAVILPMVLGVVLIIYSLLTNYERGIPGVRFLPMTYHLVIDFLAAAFLAVSPFLFGFYKDAPNVWLPHLIAGVTVVILVLVSQTKPRTAAMAKATA
ncbi:MAG TPA: SPW repeat protein [Ktedonobacteraceae bacterium]|nr:SPW repeat protein [Ktedonobacteraceae bacterium]